MIPRRKLPRFGASTDQATPTLAGAVHHAYDNPRPDVTAVIPQSARVILDVGCSTGRMGEALKLRQTTRVVGVELEDELAAEADRRLDRVVIGDVEQLAVEGADLGERFDCVVCADVLEHLRDPWNVVQWAATMLTDDGVFVVSVPNIRHAETFWSLLVRSWWPYKPVGIFDRTHLRFFARNNLPELFYGSGLEVTDVRRVHRLRLEMGSRWNCIAPLLGDFGTLQFVVVAQHKGER